LKVANILQNSNHTYQIKIQPGTEMSLKIQKARTVVDIKGAINHAMLADCLVIVGVRVTNTTVAL
jgi:hypothetical protein